MLSNHYLSISTFFDFYIFPQKNLFRSSLVLRNVNSFFTEQNLWYKNVFMLEVKRLGEHAIFQNQVFLEKLFKSVTFCNSEEVIINAAQIFYASINPFFTFFFLSRANWMDWPWPWHSRDFPFQKQFSPECIGMLNQHLHSVDCKWQFWVVGRLQ